MANGFLSNAAFFKLSFLDKTSVALGRQFEKLIPVLWMKGGAIGKCPVMLDEEIDAREQHMTDFVPKPLYTRNELQSFRRKSTVDGIFVATEETVQSVEDLEKLLFLWQEETEERLAEDTVSVDGEIRSEDGLTYSRLVIGQNQ